MHLPGFSAKSLASSFYIRQASATGALYLAVFNPLLVPVIVPHRLKAGAKFLAGLEFGCWRLVSIVVFARNRFIKRVFLTGAIDADFS